MGDSTSRPSVFKRTTAVLVSLALISGYSFGTNTGSAFADDAGDYGISAQDTATTYPADKTPGTGEVAAGISGSYNREAAAALLTEINRIRAEAKTEGIVAIWGNNDAYYNSANIANGSVLAWSNEVENYAMIRAAEHGSMPDLAHFRPDGSESKNSIPKTTIGLENLAWHPNAASGLKAWYDEKEFYLQHLDYLKYKGTASAADHPDTDQVWGHYSTLIANEWQSVGLGWFVPDGALYNNGGLAGEFSDKPGDSTTPVTRNSGDCIQNTVFSASNLTGSIAGPETVATGGTADYTATVKLSDAAKGKYGVSSALTIPADAGSWASSDTDKATVSDGTVTGVAVGSTTLSYSVNGTQLATKSVTVQTLTIASVTAPSAVSTAAGVAPTLPTTVHVKYTNNTEADVPVTWDTVADSKYHGGSQATSFNVEGTVAGWTPKVSVTVNVAAATKTSAANPAGVTTAAGTAPTLPTTAVVTWSNGDTTNETITWDAISSDKYHGPAAGTFNATGKVAGFDVTCAVTVTAATVTNVAAPPKVTAVVDVAPALPEKLSVTWSNGDTTQEAVTWDTVPSTNYDHVGNFSVNGTCSGQNVTCAVEVMAAAINGVTNPSAVSTAAGTAPSLPSTVSASFDNGTTGSVAVTWDTVDASKYHGGPQATSFNVEGTVAGWADKVTVKVNVAAATKTSAANPAGVTTAAGTAPTLPTTAVVTWSNGDTTNETITWDTISSDKYHGPAAGTFNATGKVAGFDVTCAVSVTAATAQSVAAPADVTTPAGTEPALPANVAVTWSNGDVTQSPVTWDAIAASKYHGPAATSFDVTGTVEGLTATQHVIVSAATAASTAPLSNVTTPSGTAPTLDTTVRVTWSNGDTTDETITWNSLNPADYQKREGNEFDATGTVAGTTVTQHVIVSAATVVSIAKPSVSTVATVAPVLPTTAEVTWSNGDKTQESASWDPVPASAYAAVGSFTVNGTCQGTPVVCDVDVVAATIDSIGAVSATTPAGTAPVLPSTVSAHYNDNTSHDVAVTWDTIDPSKYHGPEAGSFTVEGTVDGWAKKVTATVSVQAATAVSAGTPAAVSTPAGTAPALPATVEVTLSNGDKVQKPVTWNSVDPSAYHNGGSFTVPGLVEGLAVSCTVTVAPAFVIDPVGTVSTPAGVEITIPSTIPVKWSNGDVTNESVTWPPIEDSSFATPGTFKLKGTFAKGTPAETVDVFYEVTVADAVATKLDNTKPVKVETTAGTAPALPQTILCLMSDGTTKEVPVTWETIDPQRYAEGGTFKVVGKVQGLDGPFEVTAEVTVQPAEKKEEAAAQTNQTKAATSLATTAKTGDSAGFLLSLFGGVALLFGGLATRMRRRLH